jgi:hypothetical protein
VPGLAPGADDLARAVDRRRIDDRRVDPGSCRVVAGERMRALAPHGAAGVCPDGAARGSVPGMPFVMFGSKGKARRVPDGQFEKRRCPECDKTTVFRECVVEKTFTAYHFIDLWSSKSTQFCCDACGSIMALEKTLAPELSAREQAQLDALAGKQAAIAAKQDQLERQEAQRRKQAQAQSIEDELAAIKARLGKK